MAKKEQSLGRIFSRGILQDNPVLCLLLGTCPILAVSTSAKNGLGMGIAATFVLILTNFIISLIRNLVSDKVRIPVFITVIAGVVTIIQLLIKAYVPALDKSLGIFIPLITVNCIILGRAEAFASKNNPLKSAVDGLGMGMGFTLALLLMSAIREITGNGTIFDIEIPVISAHPMNILKMPPGGFFVYGILIAGMIKLIKTVEDRRLKQKDNVDKEKTIFKKTIELDCTNETHDCKGCTAKGSCGMSEYRSQLRPSQTVVPKSFNDEEEKKSEKEDK